MRSRGQFAHQTGIARAGPREKVLLSDSAPSGGGSRRIRQGFEELPSGVAQSRLFGEQGCGCRSRRPCQTAPAAQPRARSGRTLREFDTDGQAPEGLMPRRLRGDGRCRTSTDRRQRRSLVPDQMERYDEEERTCRSTMIQNL